MCGVLKFISDSAAGHVAASSKNFVQYWQLICKRHRVKEKQQKKRQVFRKKNWRNCLGPNQYPIYREKARRESPANSLQYQISNAGLSMTC
jgi:hypothetical protein